MAELRRTPIWAEVDKIFKQEQPIIHHKWECFVHANGKTHKCMYVNTYSQFGNYMENFTDRLTITATIPEGTWQHEIIPYKNNLEITLRKTPMHASVNPIIKENAEIEMYRYKAFLFDTSSKILESTLPSSESGEVLNRLKAHTFEAQLVNKTVDKIRLLQVGGTYPNVTGFTLVRELLTKYSLRINEDMSDNIIGVTYYPKPSEIVKNQINIDDGSYLIYGPNSAIHQINRQAGGIFLYGFKYYHQKDQWFLFAPYDTTQYETSTDSLTIINIPNNRLTNSEKTWRKTPTQLFILATSEVRAIDMSNEKQMNEGNGTRFLDSSKIMEGFTDYDEDEDLPVIHGKQVLSEFILEEREDAVFNVTGQSKITNAHHIEYAELTRRNGATIQIKWEHAKSGMIYPGMPTKYVYLVDDIPFEIYGCVIGVQYQDQLLTNNPADQKFGTVAAITIFTANKIPKNFNPT